jgi:hypothetical protein
MSDHSLLHFQLPLLRPPLQQIDIETRAWKNFDADKFRSDLLSSELCQETSFEGLSVDQLQEMYDTILPTILDKHAPRRSVRKRYQPLTPWFDADCSASKRKSRAFEHRYRRSKSSLDRQIWIRQVRSTHELYKQKQNLYWEGKVKDSQGNPRKLWRTLSNVMGKGRNTSPATPLDELTAEKFSKAFVDKVQLIRSSTSTAPQPSFEGVTCKSSFELFGKVDPDHVLQLIRNAPNKNCSLDPVPTWIVKQFAQELIPFITSLCNASLSQGTFPSTQKCALVTPILKKSNLDASDVNNYRPISNLSFLSKLLERCVNVQLNEYLQENNLLPSMQSAYRKLHSTESAVLKVLSDVYSAADKGQISILALLDMSAAFDTVDYEILLNRLLHGFGIKDLVASWFHSYLTDRTQCICYNGQTSAPQILTCGVPQGSVLGPILFLVYSAGAVEIAEKHGFSAHAYADDLQLYDHGATSSCRSMILRLSACVTEINTWMASNRLRLNPAKTELIWLGSARRLASCPMEPQDLAGVLITPSTQVRDLGVMVDNDLSLTSHVSHITSSCYYHIRQLRTIRRSLSTETAHALVRALIHSRLDYCNGVLAALPQYQLTRLQSVLRSAARMVLRLPASASVTDAIRDKLHWLPVPQRIIFKLCMTAYKCQHNLAPQYLAEFCVPVELMPGRSRLRSAAAEDLVIPNACKSQD